MRMVIVNYGTTKQTSLPLRLLDLHDFHSEIKAIKGIGNVLLPVEGVPDNDRWTRALNQ